NTTDEMYPDSTILDNESLSDNNQFDNKNLLFGEQTSIKVDEVLKRLLDAEVFVKNEAVAFFWQKFMNLQGKSGATLKLIDKSHPSYKEFTEKTVLLYDSITNTIYATEESLQNYSKETIAEAFIHEVAHSTTVQAYFNPKTFEERQFRDFIDKAYEQYKHLADRKST